jgi:hypothetical protein
MFQLSIDIIETTNWRFIMKFLITLFTVLILSVNLSFSYTEGWQFIGEFEVGKRPSQVLIMNDSFVFVFCAGWDANQNGIREEGDEPASIWYFWTFNDQISSFQSFSDYSKPQKLIDLDFRPEQIPLSPVLFEENREIFIPGPKGVTHVKIYPGGTNLPTLTATKEVLIPQIPVAISTGKSKSGHDRLYLSMIDKQNNTGNIIVYDLIDKVFYDTISAYSNVQMSLPCNNGKELYILNSDTLNTESKLQVVHVGENIGLGKHLLLKDMGIPVGANFIAGNGTIYIVSNYKSNFTTIDQDYNLLTGLIKLPKDGGPREIAKDKNWMSTYNGYVYQFQQYKGNVTFTDSLKAYGRAEGMAISELFFTIATPYTEGSNKPDSTITLYGKEPVSVEENKADKLPAIYPNPANDYLTLNKEIFKGEIEIYSFSGEKLLTANTTHLNIRNLASGFYFVKSADKMFNFIKK